MKMKTRNPLCLLLSPLLLGTALLSTVLAQNEVSFPVDMNLFGGDLPQQEGGSSRRPGTEGQSPLAREGYGQTLVFKDGRELRGEVVEISQDQVVWKRADASEPLRFPRSEVRRIVTETSGRNSQNLFQRFFNQRGNQTKKAGKPSLVTLKLPGGDWLFGKVASTDGQTFAVQLGEKSQLNIPRTRIEWMHFGDAPAPAFGFSGSTLDMEGWLPANATMELVNGTLTVKGSSFIGRNIAQPDRFEISFELPEDAEEGTRLWLQPFGPQPNCYGRGTAEIRFGRKEISHMLFLDKFTRSKDPLPKESLEEKGPVKYRVFYDEAAKRVAVLRNGRKVGDWTYLDNKDPAGNAAAVREFRFNGICFDNENQNPGEKPLKFNQLHMLPWDGALPKADATADDQDHFSARDGAPVSGKLEVLTEKEVTFAGTPHPTEAGTFIRFPELQDAAFAGAEAKLDFGQQGEFSVRKLEVRDGKVHCETSFSSDFELPLSALQRLTFPLGSSPASATADVIVFKNGDELAGKALFAGLPGPLRWRTANGQEVNFESSRIAGLRLAATPKAAEAEKTGNGAAMIELRNGERLTGKLLALDEKQLHMEHTHLGSLALDRSQLWHLFPNAQLKASDGGLTPGGWKWTDPGAKVGNRAKATMESAHWVHLDGTYFIRNGGNVSYFDVSTMPGLEYQISPEMERFELRVEATGLEGQAGNFLMALIGKNATTLNATLSYSQLQAVVMNPQGRQPNWREIPLQEKLGVNNVHRAMRLFVDTKAGTCDFVLDGVHVARIGSDKNERLQKAQYTARIVPYPNQTSILSHLWIGPWNGELPMSETETAGTTALANGDVAPGTPKVLREGKLTIDSELGELNFPLEKTLALDFGGAMEAKRVPTRLRLADGTTINVDTFRWEGAELTAHSSTLGDLRLPADVVHEIIYDPAPAQPPMAVMPKALAQKRAKENTPVLPNR